MPSNSLPMRFAPFCLFTAAIKIIEKHAFLSVKYEYFDYT